MINRSEFLKICGGACVGLIGMPLITGSCVTSARVEGSMDGKVLSVSASSFEIVKNGEKLYRRQVIVNHDSLNFPIVVYRLTDSQFRAFLLRCTHQGNELSVHGDIISCSAHGSEFNSSGEVVQGPAAEPLRSFPVTFENTFIHVQLA